MRDLNAVVRRAWAWFTALADRIIGEQRDEPELRRLRILTLLLLLLYPACALSMIRALVIVETETIVASAVLLVFIPSVLELIRRGASSNAAAQLVGGVFMSILVVGGFYTGGVFGPSPGCLAVVPVLLTLSLGGTTGLWWCGVAIAGIGLHALATDGDPQRITQATLTAMFNAVVLSVSAYAFDLTRGRALAQANEARRRAEESASAKSRFLANMSHEIRTPMNGVLGMLGLLRDAPLDGKERDYAELAHASGVTLLDLLNDILDFSKIDAGQLALEPLPFDLRSTVEDVLDQVALLAGTKDIALGARYSPDTPSHVVGDTGRVRQVLLNLVNNAVKFTERGHVLVSVEHLPEDGSRFRVEVEDTGIGIPAETQASIFEQFQQADSSTTRTHGGTGLGLAIVRELVELMGGRVGLDSEPGRGSTFWFEVPLPLAEGTSVRSKPRLLAGLRILVVDDHQINRRILDEQLAGWGLQPESCASGPAALRRLREAKAAGRPFPLAVLDFHMPSMDGVQLAQQIKRDPDLASTVLVMLSSIADHATVEPSDDGFAASLVKPVHQSVLIDTLTRVMGDVDRPPPDRGTSTDDSSATPSPDDAPPTMRVLVVEDNMVNRRVAQRMLEQLGCEVDVVTDGRAALEILDSASYDLVLMDVQMPVMDGLEATRSIRRRERERSTHTPIVAMTAHAMESDRDRCLEAGMDDYISKPVHRRDLRTVLRSFSPHRPGAPADHAAPSRPCASGSASEPPRAVAPESAR